MALEPPVLDDRTFEELLTAARRRIPRYTPEWTDFNDSDPGMTLVQLFAWFTETMLVQMNQIPELHYVKFLEMLDVEPESAKPARAPVTFAITEVPKEDSVPPLYVPRFKKSTPITAEDGSLIVFETARRLPLIHRPLVHLIRKSASDTAVDLLALNEARGRNFAPFGDAGQASTELLLGFKARLDSDARPESDKVDDAFPGDLCIYLHLVPPAHPHQPPINVTSIDEFRQSRLRIEPRLRFAALNENDEREVLEVVEDSTKGLQQSGYIMLHPPRSTPPFCLPGWPDEPCFWIVASIDRSFEYGKAPRLERLSPNTVEAEALETISEEPVGRSNGMANQRFELHRTPVEPTSLKIEVVSTEGGNKTWTVTRDLINSKSEDAHVVLDPGSGELSFGDGQFGRIPEPDAEIFATYRAGGGKKTNVSTEAIAIDGPDEDLEKLVGVNHHPATGGLDAEDIDTVKRRAPGKLRSLDRAVTLKDYEDLARQKGGMARAKAMALHHPDFPEIPVTGTVTVYVVPPVTPYGTLPPRLSSAELQRVGQVLRDRRLVGVEVFVAAAKVVPMRVTAYVVGRSGVSFEQVRRNAQNVLNRYLNSAERVIGEELYRDQLYAELRAAADVERVVEMQVETTDYGANVEKTDTGFRVDEGTIFWGQPDHEIRPWSSLSGMI